MQYMRYSFYALQGFTAVSFLCALVLTIVGQWMAAIGWGAASFVLLMLSCANAVAITFLQMSYVEAAPQQQSPICPECGEIHHDPEE